MFFCGKKTVYLSFYHEQKKRKPAGFMQLSQSTSRLILAVNIQCTEIPENDKYSVLLHCGEERIKIGAIAVNAGIGCFRKEFYTSNDNICLDNKHIRIENIRAVEIVLSGQKKIIGLLMAEKDIRFEDAGKPGDRERGAISAVKAASRINTESTEISWSRLLEKYQRIHPFGDNRVFISLDLRELVILPERYHKLINNSFLLHGFYNYRHLILGEDVEFCSKEGNGFYLGVPGVYFEREMQVAEMFGFEGFACEGSAAYGKFGYYVKEISLY